MKLQLDPWQKDFIKTKGDKILCTGRQVGKTEICAIDCAEYAIKPDNPHPILMTAPTKRQAYLLFDKTLKYLMDNYPRKVIIKGPDRPTKTKIELFNGMKIYCLPTGAFGLGIRGLTIGRSYEDENARVSQEIEAAIAPMVLTTGGARIKLSTPSGAEGEFYRTWINEDKIYDSYTRFSINTEEVISKRKISATWTAKQRERGLILIEQAKSRMSKAQYAQEYLGEFIESLHRWFSEDLIRKTCVRKRRLSISQEREYYLGVDIARMGEDDSAFVILEKTGNQELIQVEGVVTRKTLTTDTEDRIWAFERTYNFREIYIDAGSGSLGVGVFDHLLKDPRTRSKVVAINNRARSLDKDDRAHTKLMKEDLYDNLRSLMERGSIKLLDDDDMIDSLRSVQYEHATKAGQPTKLRIFGVYTHLAEAAIRAAWSVSAKNIKVWVDFI